MAVIEPTDAARVARTRPGVTVDKIREATAARLVINGEAPAMALA
jgi:acyl CoA:acetate/3-ketoacid CoA transferase beta subunit